MWPDVSVRHNDLGTVRILHLQLHRRNIEQSGPLWTPDQVLIVSRIYLDFDRIDEVESKLTPWTSAFYEFPDSVYIGIEGSCLVGYMYQQNPSSGRIA